MNSHAKRWITGVIAVPILFVVILYGPPLLFSAVIAFFVVGGAVEYNSMVFKEKYYWEKTEGLVIAFLIPLAAYLGGVS